MHKTNSARSDFKSNCSAHWLNQNWQVKVNCIFRECNLCADRLAKRALEDNLGLQFLKVLPHMLELLLEHDQQQMHSICRCFFFQSGIKEFLEWSILRSWMKQWLRYCQWYCTVALLPDVTIDEFFCAPIRWCSRHGGLPGRIRNRFDRV